MPNALYCFSYRLSNISFLRQLHENKKYIADTGKNELSIFLQGKSVAFYVSGIYMLSNRWKRVIEYDGPYLKELIYFNNKCSLLIFILQKGKNVKYGN